MLDEFARSIAAGQLDLIKARSLAQRIYTTPHRKETILPELTKMCYRKLGDACDETLTHASKDDTGRHIGFCGTCAHDHRRATGQPVRVLGTTDWVKPEPAPEPAPPVAPPPVYPSGLPSIGNDAETA